MLQAIVLFALFFLVPAQSDDFTDRQSVDFQLHAAEVRLTAQLKRLGQQRTPEDREATEVRMRWIQGRLLGIRLQRVAIARENFQDPNAYKENLQELRALHREVLDAQWSEHHPSERVRTHRESLERLQRELEQRRGMLWTSENLEELKIQSRELRKLKPSPATNNVRVYVEKLMAIELLHLERRKSIELTYLRARIGVADAHLTAIENRDLLALLDAQLRGLTEELGIPFSEEREVQIAMLENLMREMDVPRMGRTDCVRYLQ